MNPPGPAALTLGEILRQRDELRELLGKIIAGRFLEDAQRAQSAPSRQRASLELITRAQLLLAQQGNDR